MTLMECVLPCKFVIIKLSDERRKCELFETNKVICYTYKNQTKLKLIHNTMMTHGCCSTRIPL